MFVFNMAKAVGNGLLNLAEYVHPTYPENQMHTQEAHGYGYGFTHSTYPYGEQRNLAGTTNGPSLGLDFNSRLRALGVGPVNTLPPAIEQRVGQPQQTDSQVNKGYDLFTKAEFIVPPIDINEFGTFPGKKGIQGKFNSCYLDSTLISCFAFNNVFDSYVLKENPDFQSVQAVSELAAKIRNLLGNHIVNPLRTNYFCPCEPILQLRELLLPLNPKITRSFMDPEEFILLLFDQALNLKGFFTYNETQQSDFIHQIDVADLKKDSLVMNTQRLLEISLNTLKMKFTNLPYPALILQMPRSNGKLVNGLRFIVPVLTLDVTNLIEGGDSKCCICNDSAFVECQKCFNWNGMGIESTYYCMHCNFRSHLHPSRSGHKDSRNLCKSVNGKQEMELMAVICVRAHHFVSFVRTMAGPWVFFDSNPCGDFPITEVFPKFDRWLPRIAKMTEGQALVALTKKTHPHLERLLTDSHLCIYRPIARETEG